MEMVDEMELLFQEIGNDTILPGNLSSFHDPTWSDHHLPPISNSISMSPDETHWSVDFMKGNLLTDTVQSFSDENKIGSHSHGFDVPLQQSPPPGSWDSLFSDTILDDSYVKSFLETLSPLMVSHGSPMESLSVNNPSDDLGSLVELLQKPTGGSTSGWTSDHSVGSTKVGGSSKVPGGGLSYQLSSSPSKRRRLESSLPDSNRMEPSGFNTSDWNLNPARTVKKKTKPGSRSVPKDRMLTYACYAELRELIPNGEKMSIDRLLHRTIKQLYFLQSVAKHAKGLAKHQLLEDWKDPKDHFKNVDSGVEQACEIENKMMVCPLIVEDLSTPGQMLIRILCQEQGFFLEMVDMIRGFGLNILKGSMEVHEAKIHAHYIVEAEENRFVSRHEIFSSLVHVLGLTDPSNEFSEDDVLGNVRQGGVGLLNDSVQSTCGAPTSLPNRMPCITIF